LTHQKQYTAESNLRQDVKTAHVTTVSSKGQFEDGKYGNEGRLTFSPYPGHR
jgi:hypothetical protein